MLRNFNPIYFGGCYYLFIFRFFYKKTRWITKKHIDKTKPNEKVKNRNDKIRRDKYINSKDPQFTAIDSNSKLWSFLVPQINNFETIRIFIANHKIYLRCYYIGYIK